MSLFAAVSRDRVLRVGPFDEIAALARQASAAGDPIRVRPAKRSEQLPRGWAVQVSAAGITDLLQCLDEADARTTLDAVRAHGVRAEVVRL